MPEEGPLGVAVHAPAPALAGPELLVLVPAVLDEFQVLAIGDHVFGRLELWYVDGACAILVVEPVGRVVQGLAQGDIPRSHLQHLVLREEGVVLHGIRPLPVLRRLHKMQWHLADEHRGGLDVNALVLEAHH